MSERIDAVIFDCDGVLVDSEYLCNEGLELALKDWNIEEQAESLYGRFRGWKLDKILAEIESLHEVELGSDFEPHYRGIVAQLFDQKLRPVPNIQYALDHIRLPKAVASNGPVKKMLHSLGLTDLLGYFEGRLISAYEVGCWKPDPGLFIHAAQALDTHPRNVAVIEDSEVGIQAAIEAGMQPFFYQPQSGSQLDASQAHVFDDMKLLPALLGQNNGGQNNEG